MVEGEIRTEMGLFLLDVVDKRCFVLILKCCRNGKNGLKSRMKPSFFFIYLLYIVYIMCSVLDEK
jgi:hypothetical protein